MKKNQKVGAVIQSIVCTTGLYGAGIQRLSKNNLEPLRRATAGLTRTGNAGKRCVHTALSMAADPLEQ